MFFTIALLFKIKTGVTVAALAVLSVALVVVLLIKPVRKNRVIPCSLASAILACILLLTSVNFYYNPAVAYKGKTCDISATLISEPEYEYGNCYYTAKVYKIDSLDTDLKLRLTFSSVPDAEPYDEIHGKFTFYIPGESNDASLTANVSNGIFIAAYPSGDDYEVIAVPESEKPLGKTIIDIRTAIKNAVYSILPNEYGALAVALLIGDKSGLSAETLSNFSFIGISHIICVSGYHLSLWSMLVYELLRKTRMGSRLSSVICIFPVIFFMLISGMTYSVIRAGIMMLVYLISNVFFRKRDPLNSLGFSLMLIAVFNPFAMGSASLQLSALATAGIILYSEYFAPKTEEVIGKIKIDFLRRFVRSAFSTLAVTFAATAFTLPVSLSLYNRFNFIVFAANLIAVPISGLCMVLCAFGAVIGCFTESLINLPAYFGGSIARFIIWFSDKFAEFKLLSFNIEKDETAVIIISVFLICFFSLLLAYYGKAFPRLTCTICSVVFVVSILTFSLTERSITKLRVVDCGNGTSVVLSKGNESILIGCGGTEFLGNFNLCNAVVETGNDLKAVILPDSDEKSCAYFTDVINEFRPSEIYCDGIPSYSEPLLKNADMNGFEDEKNFLNFDILCVSVNGKSAVLIENEDAVVLVLFDPIKDISQLPEKFQRADVVITRSDYPAGIEKFGSVLTVINAENSRGVILQNEIEKIGINCAATAGCGDIIIKADDRCISSYREC